MTTKWAGTTHRADSGIAFLPSTPDKHNYQELARDKSGYAEITHRRCARHLGAGRWQGYCPCGWTDSEIHDEAEDGSAAQIDSDWKHVRAAEDPATGASPIHMIPTQGDPQP